MARTTSDRTGLEFDDADPDDRRILERQRAAARDAGKRGDDRTGTARGRADLEAAYDEGAAEAAAPSAPAAGGSTTGKPAAAGGTKVQGPRNSSGTRPTRSAAPSRPLPRPHLRPPRSLDAKDAGGFLLGLVIHALVVSYIRYGAQGPKGWMRAKFLNRPIQGEDLAPRGPDGEEAAEGRIDPKKPII